MVPPLQPPTASTTPVPAGTALTRLCSFSLRGVVLRLEPSEAGLSGMSLRAGGSLPLGAWAGLPGSEGGSCRGEARGAPGALRGTTQVTVQEGRGPARALQMLWRAPPAG